MNTDNLSKQEIKIAHLIANGLIEKEIADELFISPATVHTHKKNIFKKLGARNIADVTRIYMLHLPKPSMVLKALLFLSIQGYILCEDLGLDMRKTSRAKTSVKVLRTKIRTKQYYL